MGISIDQNSHLLWDTVPKLHALSKAGYKVTHFVEDIDVAFTAIGAQIDNPALRVSREKFYQTGGCDWGASLFYSDFLGRLPVEPRNFKPQLGVKLSAFAKRANLHIDELYNNFATSDNWMLIGSSFISDRNHHRLLGDISLEEIEKEFWQIFDLAQTDSLRVFCDEESQKRTKTWFAHQREIVQKLYDKNPSQKLDDFYIEWMKLSFENDSNVQLKKTSELFELTDESAGLFLLNKFTQNYDQIAELYNQAIRETDLGLHELDTKNNELPFFVTLKKDNHFVRCNLELNDNKLCFGDLSVPLNPDKSVPIDKLKSAGVTCLIGKAILLVIQVRIGNNAQPLALPFHGSSYMPTAHRLTKLLVDHKILDQKIEPILRVRFHLLDRLKDSSATIQLPKFLADVFDADKISAQQFASSYQEKMNQSANIFNNLKDADFAKKFRKENFSAEFAEIQKLTASKMELVKENPKQPAVREIGQQIKKIQTQVDQKYFAQVWLAYQTANIDFWDSRGAILPWCVSAAGKSFYSSVIKQASIYEEHYE